MIKHYIKLLSKNGDTTCAKCGAHCQGFKAPNGEILCADCLKRYW